MIPLICLSLNHKHAPQDVRKVFAFSTSEGAAFCTSLLSARKGELTGAVLLSTCNRLELYASLADYSLVSGEIISFLQQTLAQAKNADSSLFRKYSLTFMDEDALRHLFSVASGLDSMVLGENQILGQLRTAYKDAAGAGTTDFLLNTAFQKALTCAKRVKTETNLSKTTESIATLAVKEILAFTGRKPCTVLVIGASGETGSLVVRDLAEKAGVQVLATVRSHYPLPELAQVTKISYDERYAYFDQADVVVSATKSPHCTVSLQDTLQALATAKKRLFIDLAVPNDIDPALSGRKDISLTNIDSFIALSRAHNEEKKAGLLQAKDIVAQEVDTTVKELCFHDNFDFVQDFCSRIKNKNGMQFLYEMRRAATAEELNMLLALCRRMYEKDFASQGEAV